MSSILKQHFEEFAREELEKQAVIHALMDDDKKLMDVNISKAIDTQFEPDDLDEMLACGMSTQDVVDYINDKFGKLNEINESLGIALHNLNVLLSELTKRSGGNYNGSL